MTSVVQTAPIHASTLCRNSSLEMKMLHAFCYWFIPIQCQQCMESAQPRRDIYMIISTYGGVHMSSITLFLLRTPNDHNIYCAHTVINSSQAVLDRCWKQSRLRMAGLHLSAVLHRNVSTMQICARKIVHLWMHTAQPQQCRYHCTTPVMCWGTVVGLYRRTERWDYTNAKQQKTGWMFVCIAHMYPCVFVCRNQKTLLVLCV